jgi:DNA-binding transcriptional LysR family regulator
MEMREIEAFLAVADELHFGRAAHRLHVSTSHVSETIRTLERRVGGPLFERTSRRVTLTPLGAQLLSDFRPAHERLVRGLAEARRTALRQRGHESLSVGFTSTLTSDFATRLIESFERDHAGFRVARSDLAAHTIMTRIESGEFGVDVVIMWMPESFRRDPGERLRAGPVLGTAPRAALMGRRHPLASRAGVDIEDLADFDLHHPGTTPAFDDGWTPPRTPAGTPLRRILSRIAVSSADMTEILGDDLVHLTIVSLPIVWSGPGLVTVPLTGLPPVVCAPVWSAAHHDPRIAEFVAAAGRTGRLDS